MVTIQDIAEKAGVSMTTVSLVLNNRGEKLRIAGRTSKRIKELADEMGYCKNNLAYAMTTGKTNTVGLIGQWEGSYGADTLKGILMQLDRKEYSAKFLFHHNKMQRIEECVRKCIEHRLTGVICNCLNETEIAFLHEEFSKVSIPFVMVDNAVTDKKCSHIYSDDFDGSRQVGEYLCKLGHKKIIYVTPPMKDNAYAVKRYAGFIEGLKNSGIAWDDRQICVVDAYYEITESFSGNTLRAIAENKATAAFCCTDPVAMKFMKVASGAGIRIPEDFSVVGYAGLDYSLWSIPALTTVRQPFEDMGRMAAEVLLAEIEKKTPARDLKLSVELIVRQSTAECKS